MSDEAEKPFPPKKRRATRPSVRESEGLAEFLVEVIRTAIPPTPSMEGDFKAQASREAASHRRQMEREAAEHDRRIANEDKTHRHRIELIVLSATVGAGVACILVGFSPYLADDSRKTAWLTLSSFVTAGLGFLAGKASGKG